MKYLRSAVSMAVLALLLVACSGQGPEGVPEMYSLKLEVSGEGAASALPDKSEYAKGEEIELAAVPATGWLFSHWEGDLTGTANPATIEVVGDQSVTAVFAAGQHVLEVSVTGEGSVSRSPDQAEYSYGSEVTLTAVPVHGGWAFSRWEGDLEGTENPTTVEIGGDLNVSAVFVEVRHSLDVVVSGQGAVHIDPDEVDYEHGQEVNFMATPSYGWLFSHWEDDLTGSSNPSSVEMDGDKSVRAVFIPERHTVTVTVTGQGSVARSPDQAEYDYGSDVNLTAIPADRGWVFSHWDGDLAGSVNPATVEVDGNKSVSAIFVEVQHTLDVSATGQGTVVVDPDQPEYTHGEEVELTASPDAGWLFSHWEGDLTGTTNPAIVAVIGETEVSAHFTSILSGLVSSFYNSVTINGRVHGMSLDLRSTLPATVNIDRVEVLRTDGSVFASAVDPNLLGALDPGGNISLSVSPRVPPLLSEVQSWTVHWYGSHDGQNFEVIGNFAGF